MNESFGHPEGYGPEFYADVLEIDTFYSALLLDWNIMLDESDYMFLPATQKEYDEYFADRDIDSDESLHDLNPVGIEFDLDAETHHFG